MGLPQQVGVLGGGRMGAGIAHAFLVSGSTVIVVERDDAAVAAARERVGGNVAASHKRGALVGSIGETLARLTVTSDYAAFAGAELVVEAVPEIPALKHESLARVESVVTPEAWIATNTSSLSVTDLAVALNRPERVCGLHFFNPVPASSLIEIVTTTMMRPELLERATEWVLALGKTPITVSDQPGFASSRLGLAIALEAMRMVEDGVASAEDIDTAMVLGYRHPVGPLHTSDIVGLDVRLGIAEYLTSTLGERFRPPAILRELVAEGHLGRKSGRGFFDYSSESGTNV